MSATDETIVSILGNYPEKPTSGDVIAALALAEHAGHDRALAELRVQHILLIEAAVLLECAAEHLRLFGMPKTSETCLAKATAIRTHVGLAR